MSAAEKIAEVIYNGAHGAWTYDSPVERAVSQWDPRPTADAVLAAIRDMSPAEQAEIIGGEVVDMGEGYSWVLGPAVPNEPDPLCGDPYCSTMPHRHYGDRTEYVEQP